MYAHVIFSVCYVIVFHVTGVHAQLHLYLVFGCRVVKLLQSVRGDDLMTSQLLLPF